MKNIRGFSLVEIFIVLVVIGILAAIAIPNYTSLKSDSEIKQSAQKIATVQRVMRYYAALNDLKEGDAILSTDFLGSGSDKLLNIPISPFTNGGYSYMATVPASGVCYAAETDTTHSTAVNNYAAEHDFCH